jgi:carbon-monoxide dehydrogenase medium subunit
MRLIRLNRFDYHEPATVEEASALLKELPEAILFAGGTDVVPLMKHETISPANLVSIAKIDGIRKIEKEDGKLVLGAGVRLATVIENEEISRSFPILGRTASQMASRQVRNLATLGGNVANSSPSADMAPPLLVLDAKFVLANGQASREVDAGDFFTGPGENVLEKGEILKAIVLPLRSDPFRAYYIKHTVKKGLELAIVGVAVSVELDDDEKVKEARIALGAVAPTPLRVREAEEVLTGERLREPVIMKAAALAQKKAAPIDDVRGSSWYRNDMVAVLVERGLEILARGEG